MSKATRDRAAARAAEDADRQQQAEETAAHLVQQQRENQRKQNLTRALISDIKAAVERYHLVYGLPFEDALTAQASMVIATLDSIHVDNQKALLPQMLDVLEQREAALFADEPQAEAKPETPASKIGKKAKGS